MRKILKKAHRAVVWYSLISGPITVLCGFWLARHEEKDFVFLSGILNHVGFLWILSLIYIFLALIFYREFRESLLARLAGFQEGDEREQLVTARAARSTFLLMLAIQIVFLVMSLTSFHLIKSQKPDPSGHRGLLTVGMRLDSKQMDIYSLPPLPSQAAPGDLEVKGYLMPPNTAVIFLFLILVQIASFRLISRRRYEGSEE